MKSPICRSCASPLQTSFVDLGMSPLANSLLTAENNNASETFYPLHAYVCEQCFLVQLEEFASPERIFSDYIYFSSYSDTWIRHCSDYCAHIVPKLGLDSSSKVVEIASNDGYLLQFFVKRGIPVLGIEPAVNVAKVATAKGIPTEVSFFGQATAERLVPTHQADLIVANNVLAHVPDINDFVAGTRILLSPKGTLTIEFPHLLQLIRHHQFDTIYHEHFSYLSLLAVERIFASHQLAVYDVEEVSTHGGSLRLYVSHRGSHQVTSAVHRLRKMENEAGLNLLPTYTSFAATVATVKCELVEFFAKTYRMRQTIVGYGAAAKGNTLLNYCGIGKELLPYVADRSPHKQGRLLPGTHIPVTDPEMIFRTRPDYVIILPWNFRTEITEQLADIRSWGGKFVVAVPNLEVF